MESYHMRSYVIGITVFACILVSVLALASMIGRSIVYTNKIDNQRIQTCVDNGQEWALCWKLIHG